MKQKQGMACAHRITGGEASYCFLQSSRMSEEGEAKSLVFHGAKPTWPVRCDPLLLSLCPFREEGGPEEGKGALVRCPHCKKRHRGGSTAKRLCEDWHSVKAVLKEMRERRPGGRKYFEHGTTLLPYRPDTPDLVRQLIWLRLKGAIARRDAYTCQDCGDFFGRVRRRNFDRSLRRGKGGYRWESLEVHHIVPRSRGGSDHPGNLKTLCPRCHGAYTSDLRMASAEARRREREVLSRMRECDDGESGWDAPTDY
ncbi:MAG: HNH endonuclease [Methanomassiliicoccales archaeon]|nr:HNH endonuclease [Methanomassiliicoccales archaeon]